MTAPATLDSLIAAETARPQDPALDALVAALRRRFGGSVVAILYYGSCLRRGTLEGVVDVYVLVDTYRAAYGRSWLAFANALLPPNVFFLGFGDGHRAKAAVMSVRQFAAGCAPAAWLPSIWARFCQPTALLHARDEAARLAVNRMLATAVATAAAAGAALAPSRDDPLDLWRAVFAASYRSELRVEDASRAAQIVAADAERYAALTPLALAALSTHSPFPWGLRRVLGKSVNLLRLLKAAFTFAGGTDYLAWKIERHTGVRADLTPWQRHHPLLALPRLAWRLWRQGVI